MTRVSRFYWEGNHLFLHLYIQPRASKSSWDGLYGERIKLRIAAPPIDGQANKQCIVFLAKALKVSKSQIQIVQGKNGRNKRVQITDMNMELWDTIFRGLQ